MAYPSIFLLALLFVAASPLASGLTTVNGMQLGEINVFCRLVCDQGGDPNPNPGSLWIQRFNVILSCKGSRAYIYKAVTDTVGFFRIVVNGADGLLFDPNNCFVTVRLLPIGRCRAFPPNGILQPVNTTGPALAPVANFAIG